MINMWLQIFFVHLAFISVSAIKVPVNNEDENIPQAPLQVQLPAFNNHFQGKPIYYADEEVNIDSYLIPPNPHKPEEIVHDVLVTPAGYLLPPTPDNQNEYHYKPTEPGEQTDWYPIAPLPQKQIQVIPVRNERPELKEVKGLRIGKAFERNQIIPIPSRDLLPPREDAPNDYVIFSPSADLELPSEEINHSFTVNPTLPVTKPFQAIKYPPKVQEDHEVKFLPLEYITPPKNIPQEYKNPTRLYPKKYQSKFRPVSIPLSQVEESAEVVQDNRATKPLQTFLNNDELTPSKYEKSQQKLKLKEDQDTAKLAKVTDEGKKNTHPIEQEVSATHYRQPEQYAYTYPKEELAASLKQKPSVKSNGERTEFRMHGMKGPNSYQFGFDTGKGKNRQFRYEERDNDGHVRGHYGYVDRLGKLRVVNYDADPKLGFRAEIPAEKD